MLRVEDLTVEVGGKTVLQDFNLNIDPGEVHVLLGPNGTGKSTLLYSILGYPPSSCCSFSMVSDRG